MKLATFKKLEKAATLAYEALKADGSPEAQAKVKAAELAMLDAWRARYAAEVAAAAKKDKDEVLFTVFVPGKNHVAEHIRTNLRRGFRYLWTYRFVTLPNDVPAVSWDVENFSKPESDFRRWMQLEVAA